MFSFGSFSSIMPFIVLAITYFAGLTTYSITFAQNKINDKKLSENCIKHEVKEESETISTAIFNLIDNETFCVTDENITYPSHVEFSYIRHYKVTNSPPFRTTNFERSLYMRPPPSFLIA